MITYITILLFLVILSLLWVVNWMFNRHRKQESYYKNQVHAVNNTIVKLSNQLEEEIKKKKINVVSFWKPTVYTDEDLKRLKQNKEWIEIIIQIFGNLIINKTDELRRHDRSDLERRLWELDSLNEMLFFFYKLSLSDKQLAEMWDF